jgi:SAM-dependent methyltransferase
MRVTTERKMELDSKVLDFYAAESNYHAGLLEPSEECSRWISGQRAAKFSPWLSGLNLKKARILEYGVGSGWNLGRVPATERYGFDIARHLKETVEKRGIHFVEDLGNLEPASFSRVICHHVLEHVPSPQEVLESIYSLLEPGGKLLLYVPFEKEGRYRQFDPKEPNHHLFSWNVQSLGNLVSAAGFQIQISRTSPFGYERRSAVVAQKLMMSEGGFAAINWLALKIFGAEEIELVAIKPS